MISQTGQKVSERLLASIATEELEGLELQPESITAMMIGLKSKIATFRVQRDINSYLDEPLLAIIPGVALSELWSMMAILENVLRLISVLVLGAALLGLSAMLLTSIREREREIFLLCSIGASPMFLFMLIELEALLITLFAGLLAIGSLYATIFSLGNFMTDNFGVVMSANIFYQSNLFIVAFIIVSSLVICAIPAYAAFLKASVKQK